MGISFSNGIIEIDNMSLTFTDIYNYNNYYGWGIVSKNGTKFQIDASVILKNDSYLYDTLKTVIVTGNLFQIRGGCTMRLGEKYSPTSTGNGCTLLLPNILLEYGFGGLDPNDSGNLLCYSSTIEAYGYWSFFKGNNLVEIIKSTITGFGKISGSSSVLTTVTFKKAHGKYGILRWDETIFGSTGITITSTDNYDENQNLPNLDNIIVKGTNVIEVNYGEIYGVSDLLLALDKVYNLPIVLNGSIVTNGYNIAPIVSNRNNFYHKLLFRPKIQEANGTVLYNATVRIKNRLNEIEYEGTVGGDGLITAMLTYYRKLPNQSGEIVTPHTVEITKDNKTSVVTVYVDRNMEYFPLLLSNQSSVETIGATRDDVHQELDLSNDEIISRIDNLDSLLHALIAGLGDKVTSTTQTIRYKSGVKLTI